MHQDACGPFTDSVRSAGGRIPNDRPIGWRETGKAEPSGHHDQHLVPAPGPQGIPGADCRGDHRGVRMRERHTATAAPARGESAILPRGEVVSPRSRARWAGCGG